MLAKIKLTKRITQIRLNLIFFLLLTSTVYSLCAQQADTLKKDLEKDPRKGVKFKVIPGPSYDPSIEFGLFIVPMFTYYPSKGDTISPASLTSLYGMYTTNNSYIAGFNQELYLKEDNWRIRARARAGGGGLNKDITLYDVHEGTLMPDTNSVITAPATQSVFQFDS